MAAQHIKTMAPDHGLNHLSDAIVIRLQPASETASGGVPEAAFAAARAA
jgi:hypothetical protein